MIDIHCHILPGVDDGAETRDEALAMARLAVAGGTATIIATPHVSTVQELAYTGLVAGWVAELQSALAAEAIPLCVLPGAEVFPMHSLLPALDAGAPLTLGHGGRYLLLDTPFSSLPLGLETLVYALQTRGITPILAHPERVQPIQQNPQVLEQLVQRGMLLQLTASSIIGRYGEEVAATAHTFLRLRWAHCIASDAHSVSRRRPGMREAARHLVELLGQEVTATLTRENGQRIIEGEVVPTDPLPYAPAPTRKYYWPWQHRKVSLSG